MTTLRELLDSVPDPPLDPAVAYEVLAAIESWAYGEDDFCHACGASIPARDGEGTCSDCDGKTREPGLAFRAYDRMVACQRDDHGDDECWIDALRQELGET